MRSYMEIVIENYGAEIAKDPEFISDSQNLNTEGELKLLILEFYKVCVVFKR